ncbi:hypothetical protein TNCV_4670701 [Trichonephila clavipes]|nr:hypothetical protein TNCV_4670701 [Trichonephila clavipes]
MICDADREGSKAYLQKMIIGWCLKSKLHVAKLQQNVIEDYWKPVVKIHYHIRQKNGGLKGFIRIGMRLIPEDEFDTHSGLLSTDRPRAFWELFIEVGFRHQSAWHIIKKYLNMRKIAVR